MSNKALIFIPDISGFTEFVSHTAISHSKHIISELLELLLDNNTTGLELAEVEGDALFMYKTTESFIFSDIEAQVKAMYMAFHRHLKRYEYERICRCGACSSAYNLSLKFVVHYGEVDFITVKDITKPFGEEVIKAHRLLKNEIDIKEYALYTNAVIDESDQNVIEETYDFGKIQYSFKPLADYKSEIPEINPIPDNVPKHKIISRSTRVKLPILDLYEVISNFDYRLLWAKGINKVEYEKNRVNRSGEKHRCLISDSQDVYPVTISRPSENNELVYGESTEDVSVLKKFNIYYVLKELSSDETKLTIEVFGDFKPFGILMKPLMRKKLSKNISENIKELILLVDSGFTLKNPIS